MTIEIERDAPTPMLRKYSMWIGETARNVLMDRSSGVPSNEVPGTMGIGSLSTSLMMRNRLRR